MLPLNLLPGPSNIVAPDPQTSSGRFSTFVRTATRFAAILALLAFFGAGLWLITIWMHYSQVETLRASCQRWQTEQNWAKLLLAAQEWRRLEPGNREAMQAAATAGKELRQPASVVEILKNYPAESKEDIPWLTMLADMQFGPLRTPLEGIKPSLQILKIDPRAIDIRRRLIFFYAVTVQPVELLANVREAAESEGDLPEFYAYAFLADGLKLRNALDRIKVWMGSEREEVLMVAYALNTARNLEGGVPPIDEVEATKLRNSQAQRASYLQKLRDMFPDNHQVLAYDLGQAVNAGQTLACAELLKRATSIADADYRFWRARGWLFLKAGDLSEAQQAFTEALRLHPIDWRTRYYLAELSRRNRNLEFADQQYQLAADGKQLEADFLAAADVQRISPELFFRLREFAQRCGDELTARRLKQVVSVTESTKPDGAGPGSAELESARQRSDAPVTTTPP